MSEMFCGTTQVSVKDFNGFTNNESNLEIFKIKLSSYYPLVSDLESYLDATEMLHAEKFHFEKDKNRFVICRAILKILLAQLSGLNISEVHIKTDANKKPFLASNTSVHFNLSHAEDLGIMAFNDSALGIDIEYLNRDFDFSEVLSYTMGKVETDLLLKTDNELYTFFKFWTRKEAIVKAIGTGISDDLVQIPAYDGHHKVDSKLIAGFKRLNVLSFDISTDYVASVALSDISVNSNTLIVYNLPVSLPHLISFGS